MSTKPELHATEIPWGRGGLAAEDDGELCIPPTPTPPPAPIPADPMQTGATPADAVECNLDTDTTISETTGPPATVTGDRDPTLPCARRDGTQRSPTTTPTPTLCALTDSGNAEFFEQIVDGKLAFDHRARQWVEFTGHHWHPDTLKHVFERALGSVRQQQHAASLLTDSDARKAALRWTLKSEDHRHLQDLLTLASAKPSIAVDGTNWDREPMLLGVLNGAIDLTTGRFRDGHPADYLTKVAPVVYDHAAQAPRFIRFLKEIFRDHPDLVAYLQRVFGYCLTGLTTEQVFWIFWGLGSNGKSTLIEVLQRSIFGTYAWTMPFPTATWTTAISEYQRAELPGRRLVTASEVKQRGHLHEDFVKSLTGSDTVNARMIYGRPFVFVPVAKFILRCNERPIIKDTTHAMWRRVKVIPFTQTFAPDLTLTDTLTAEAPGIFNWLLEGLRLWRAEGLCEPDIVRAETDDYRAACDVVAEFLADRCLVAEGVSVAGRDLFAAYVLWEDQRRTPADDRLSQKMFGLRIKERFPDIGKRTVRYSGVTLLTRDSTETDEQN